VVRPVPIVKVTVVFMESWSPLRGPPIAVFARSSPRLGSRGYWGCQVGHPFQGWQTTVPQLRSDVVCPGLGNHLVRYLGSLKTALPHMYHSLSFRWGVCVLRLGGLWGRGRQMNGNLVGHPQGSGPRGVCGTHIGPGRAAQNVRWMRVWLEGQCPRWWGSMPLGITPSPDPKLLSWGPTVSAASWLRGWLEGSWWGVRGFLRGRQSSPTPTMNLAHTTLGKEEDC